MDLSTVAIICFVGLTLASGTVFLVIRDLFLVGDHGTTSSQSLARRAKALRRTPTVFDEARSETLTGRIDQSFDRIVLESGNDISPMSAFLGMLASGLLIGGSILLYFDEVMAATFGMAVGMAVPFAILVLQRQSRKRKILEELPHVLDLLSRAVRAGESLDQAIALIGTEVRGVLGSEFKKCAQQIEMGLSVAAAVQAMARRISLPEMRIFATTAIVHRKTGGNIVLALERMSGVVRDRLNYQRQMKASTGAGRSATVLIAVVSPIVYAIMFVWYREHVQILIDDPLGNTLLMMAVALEVIGVLWVMQMLRSE